MSDGISAVILGSRELEARVTALTPAVEESLAVRMLKLMIYAQGYVKRERLSGQVLKTQTGHLRASIVAGTTRTPEKIEGYFGVPQGPTLAYGRAHEFGFEGVVTVREHLRRVTQAFGQPLAEPVTATVGAHVRHQHLPERSYLRTALEELAPYFERELRGALHEAVR